MNELETERVVFWLPPEREPNVTRLEDKGDKVIPAFGGPGSQLLPWVLGHSLC